MWPGILLGSDTFRQKFGVQRLNLSAWYGVFLALW